MKYVQLNDIVKFIRGITFKPNDKVKPFSDGSVVCYRTKNVQTKLDQSDLIAVPKSFVKRQEQFVKQGDILVSTANSWKLVGKCCWVPKLDYTATLGGFISLIRANESLIDPKYLYYWLNLPDTQLRLRYCGRQTTNISNMNIKRALKLKIPLPTLPEQRRIAAILDKADELRAKRRAALDKLDTLLQSIFFDMFGDPVTNSKGWRRIKFDKLLTSIDSGWSPRCEKRAAEGDEWGVLKLGAVTTCRYIESENKALPLNLQPKEQLEVKAGDLLFSRKNTAQLVAACALVMTTPAKLMLSDLIFRFRLAPNAPICPEYLWGLLTDQRKRRQIQSLATGAAGSMPNISKKRLREISIELPPYEMQAKFAEALAKCEHLRQLQAHKSQKQDNLFHALQQRAFRGELTGDKA